MPKLIVGLGGSDKGDLRGLGPCNSHQSPKSILIHVKATCISRKNIF